MGIYDKEQRQLIQELKRARIEAGLSQKEVADSLNKTQSYVSKFEAGQRRVDVIQLKELARIYKKNLDFFIK